MDWFPLLNSLRIAAISTVIVFFLGLWSAYAIARLPWLIKGALDVVLTLPLVLPPTVVGWLLLVLLSPKRPLGAWAAEVLGVNFVMNWWSAIFACVVVAFPLMYRTARGRPDAGPVRYLVFLARAAAGVPGWHLSRHGAGFCAGFG